MKYLCGIVSLLLFLSCQPETLVFRVLQGDAFGTTYTIQFYGNETFDAQKGIDSVVYVINKSMSTYLPQSDISKINSGDTTVKVDENFKNVFRISEIIHNNSKGYFDPTVGTLRNAYGFGDTQAIQQLDSKKLDSLRQFVGFKKVSLQKDGTIKKQHPEIYLDFNAVAKGYGIDQIGAYFHENGIENYLIELGGEVLAKGMNLDKQKPWVAGIESVSSVVESRSFETSVRLKDKGLAASGNYRKFRIDSVTGLKYVHTINPLTGLAEQSNLTSATVVAPSCALADAYATTFMAMGLKKSKELLSRLNQVEAYLTYTDEGNVSQVYATEGMKLLLSSN